MAQLDAEDLKTNLLNRSKGVYKNPQFGTKQQWQNMRKQLAYMLKAAKGQRPYRFRNFKGLPDVAYMESNLYDSQGTFQNQANSFDQPRLRKLLKQQREANKQLKDLKGFQAQLARKIKQRFGTYGLHD